MRVVVKFGGTSIKTPARVREAARNVARMARDNDVLVVVSAMGDATNRLIRRGREVWRDAPFDAPFLHLIATGEGQSACLMAMALRALGCGAETIGLDHPLWPILAAEGQAQAQSLSGEKVNDLRDVRLDWEESEKRFRSLVDPILRSGAVAVLPGFFVRDRSGALVTLGRGGSDVTAFLLARIARADELLIATDVKGVLTADPRLVRGTALVPEIQAEMLSAVSHRGAQVLHPNALRHKPESVSVRIVHFRDLGRPEAGTTITGAAATTLRVDPRPLTLVLLFGEGLGRKAGLLANLGAFLGDRGIAVHSMTASDRVVALYLEVDRSGALLEEIHDAFVSPAGVFTEMVSSGPHTEIVLSNPAFIGIPGAISIVAETLSRNQVNIVEMVTSHADITCYCSREEAERAAALLSERLGVPIQA